MARRPAGEINAGSTADIAFLTLCFFLMTSQMDQDSGLQRQLPPIPDENQQQSDVKVNRRNILVVNINSNDRIGVGGQPIDLSQLKDKIKAFILNEADDHNLPEKEVKEIEGFGPWPVSKGVVSLQNDRGTSYDAYMKVQNELVKAFNELRSEFAFQHFGKALINVNEEQQKILKAVYPQNISEAEPRDVGKKR